MRINALVTIAVLLILSAGCGGGGQSNPIARSAQPKGTERFVVESVSKVGISYIEEIIVYRDREAEMGDCHAVAVGSNKAVSLGHVPCTGK